MADDVTDDDLLLEQTEEDAMQAELRRLGYSKDDLDEMQELAEGTDELIERNLEQLPRAELVQRAVDLDIQDAEAMTTTDLIAEIRSASPPNAQVSEPIE